VLGTIAFCAIFFVVCYFKICKSKEDRPNNVAGRGSNSSSGPKNSSVHMAAPAPRPDSAQYTTMPVNTGPVQPLAQTDGATERHSEDTRRVSGNPNISKTIQDILPTRYKLVGEGAQPTSTATAGENTYSQAMVSGGGEENKAGLQPRPPPVDPNHLPIFYGEVQYRSLKLLGQGNFGRAYLVTNEKGKHMVIKTQFCPTRELLEEADKEAQALVLMKFGSEHLLEITDVFPEGSQELCLVINFCSGGTLADQVAANNSVEEVVRMVKELCKGLAVLHAKNTFTEILNRTISSWRTKKPERW